MFNYNPQTVRERIVNANPNAGLQVAMGAGRNLQSLANDLQGQENYETDNANRLKASALAENNLRERMGTENKWKMAAADVANQRNVQAAATANLNKIKAAITANDRSVLASKTANGRKVEASKMKYLRDVANKKLDFNNSVKMAGIQAENQMDLAGLNSNNALVNQMTMNNIQNKQAMKQEKVRGANALKLELLKQAGGNDPSLLRDVIKTVQGAGGATQIVENTLEDRDNNAWFDKTTDKKSKAQLLGIYQEAMKDPDERRKYQLDPKGYLNQLALREGQFETSIGMPTWLGGDGLVQRKYNVNARKK